MHKSSTILPLHEAVEVSNAIPNSVLAAEAAKNGKTSRLEKIDTALTVASKIMRGDNQAAKQLAYWYRITEYLKKGKGMLQLGAGDDMLNLAAMGPFISFLNTDAQKVMCGILLCTNVAKLAVKAAKGELRSENRDVSVVAQELIQNFGPSVAYVPEGLMKDIALAMIMLTHLATVPKNMLK